MAENYVFDEIFGCSGHLTLPEKKWAPVIVEIFYKYDIKSSTLRTSGWVDTPFTPLIKPLFEFWGFN